MSAFHPYSHDDLRLLRRLILASGAAVDEWAGKLRRTADYLQSLSPAQAEIVAQQAMAIGEDPDDYGDEDELEAARLEIELIPTGHRLKYISQQVIAVRRRYYTGVPGEESQDG